jgi:3-phosphoshikimate 1-carboxyvinyltransferase
MSGTIPDPYEVPSGNVARGICRVPASKSVAHRALILAALAEGASRVAPLPSGDDVTATLDCLRALGAGIRERGGGSGETLEREGGTSAAPEPGAAGGLARRENAEEQGGGGAGERDGDRGVVVTGAAGRLTPSSRPLDCRGSGTTLRLLMGVCGGLPGIFTLDGNDQLRRRPVADGEGPLRSLGASVRYAGQGGFPPVVVTGRPWRGGTVTVPGATSSQFLSGLLLAAPLAAGEVAFVAPDLVSAPYAEMTALLMERFGVEVQRPDAATWRVRPGAYRAADVAVEPDASSAAFLWAAAAVTGGTVTVEGLGGDSLQGDAAAADLLGRMGCAVERREEGTQVRGPLTHGLDADLGGTPDLVPALASAACFAPGPSTFRGVAHLRFKESDRLAVLADGLSAVGAAVLLDGGRMTVVPGEGYRGATLDPRGDHRMAMAFALLGLRVPGVKILQPSCVGKSFPEFFAVLECLLS